MIPRNAHAVSRRLVSNGLRRHSALKSRLNSTVSGNPAGGSSAPTSSLFAAGLAGGGVVLVGVYGYYHFSGAKSAVDSATSLHRSITSAKDAVIQNTPPPNEVIKYLRGVAKSYGAMVPGASSYIDASFDSLEELHRTHKDEVEAIVGKAYTDIKTTVQDGQMDAATASKVFSILREQSQQLGDLANRVGADIIGPVLERHPEVAEKLGSGWSDLQAVVKDAKDSDVAKQAHSVYKDTTKQLADIFNTGFSADALAKAKALVDQKSQEIKSLSEKAARTLWEQGQKEYGEKMPDELKQVLSDQNTLSALVSGGGATAAVVSIWGRVKDIASSKSGFDKKNVQELQDFVQKKVQEAKDAGGSLGGTSLETAWRSAESWLKSVPGGQKALDAVPNIDVQSLSKIATARGDEAKRLAEETYSDVLKVLKEKADKAKSLGEDAKHDVENNGEKSDKKDSGKDDEAKKDERSKKGSDKGDKKDDSRRSK